jgi:tape measure domain-containing protein
MASAIATAYVQIIPTTDGFGKTLEKASADAGAAASDSFGMDFSKGLLKAVKVGGIAAAVTAVAALGAVMVSGFNRLSDIENASAKLSGLGWTAVEVTGIMDDALAAVKGTAFGMGDAATVAASALAAGIKPGQELEKYLKLTADAATIAGVSLTDMGAIINKTTATGVVYTDNLNQLADRGIPIFQWLAAEYGVTQEALSKMVANGEVDSATFRKVIEENIGGAALASGGTTQGSFDNLGAAVGRLGAAFLGPAFKDFPTILGAVTAKLDGLTPAFKTAGETITGVFDYIQSNSSWLIPLAIGLGLIALGITGVGISMAIAAAGGIGAYVTALVPAIASTWAFTMALLANPITWIVIGIALLIAGIIALMMNWDVVVKFLLDVWGGFVGWIMDGLNAFLGWWNGLWTAVFEFILSVWNNIVGAVVGYFTNLYNSFVAIGEGIASWWSGLWSGLVGAFSTIFEGIGGIVQGVFNTVVDFIKGYINTIIRLVNGAIDGLNGVGNFIAGITGGEIDFTIGKIPMLASGGTITGSGSVMVGEQGPEILNLGRGASVIPLDRAGGSGLTLNYVNNGSPGMSSTEELFAAGRRLKARLV